MSKDTEDKTSKFIRRDEISFLLDSLIQKGLISTIDKEGIKIFHSSSPKELLNILEQKKEKIKLIIPELEKYQQKSQIKYKAEIFEGINGVKTVTNDIISKKNETINGANARDFAPFPATPSMRPIKASIIDSNITCSREGFPEYVIIELK